MDTETIKEITIKIGIIKLAQDLDRARVELVSNNTNVIKNLKTGVLRRSYYSSIVKDCLCFGFSFSYISFVYTSRYCNDVAHVLASSTTSSEVSENGLGECPSSIVDLIISDVSLL